MWHQKTTEELFKELESSQEGLSQTEAQNRLAQYGLNEIASGRRRTALQIFFSQFKDFMILILIIAAVVAGVVGDLTDTLIIAIVVIFNAVIGFVQEYQAQRAIEALKELTALKATVLRDGEKRLIPSGEVIPGDLVFLEAGNIVPADLRLVDAVHLKAEEASLTGESQPVEKRTTPIPEENLPLGDQKNMAFSGTVVVTGRGAGVAVETGMNTQMGRIAAMIQKEEDVKTPLQKRMAQFGRNLTWAILAVIAVIFGIGLLRGEELVLMFLTAVSLAVAAIPESLPAVITIALALGAKKMVERHVLIRKLPAVESLGSVTYICADKTGTLTQNRMTVEKIYLDGNEIAITGAGYLPIGQFKTGEKVLTPDNDPSLELFLKGMALCNDATLQWPALAEEESRGRQYRDGEVLGDPTEGALLVLAAKGEIFKEDLAVSYPRIMEVPFDSTRKRMSTLHKIPPPLSKGGEEEKSPFIKGAAHPEPGEGRAGGFVAFTKGSVESLLELSVSCCGLNAASPFGEKEKSRILEAAQKMAQEGLRVLGLAYREFETLPDLHQIEKNLIFVGIAGMLDAPRPEARDAVALCRAAGIQPVMITGDHPQTAEVIARRLGILDHGQEVITGPELMTMEMAEFEARVEKIRVYARVNPEHKIKIVKGLQDKGHLVAMTGDGVNDAPALKAADIGVAMGITGTDVAKEASGMILSDDNFASIVAAVREGRRIYDNLRKFVRYLLTTNASEVMVIFVAPFFGMPLPMLPVHILWINLVTDSLPALALTVEPEEQGIMKRPPRSPNESLFSRGLGRHILWVGSLMAVITLAIMAWAYFTGDAHWQTMVFTTLVFAQLAHVLAIRSERDSFFTQGPFSNLPLLGSVALGMLLQLALIYVPVFESFFHTQPLELWELLLCAGAASVIFFAVEVEKFLYRKGILKDNP